MRAPMSPQRGFSLIEVVVGTAVFALVAVMVLTSYVRVSEAVRAARLKVVAVALANEQFEIARNLPYEDVGILGGNPSGKLLALQTLTRSGADFSVATVVETIDDAFDGTAPGDADSEDYKLLELSVSCASCARFTPLSFVTYVAPRPEL